MTDQLGPHVHLATVGNDLVLLDIVADAYFCLPDAAPEIATDPDGLTLERCSPALLGELVEAGLVMQGAASPAAP